jgi:hypothetical protein
VQTDTQAPVAVLHENGTQMCVEPGLHCPLPSQAFEPTTASPSHIPGLHIVLTGYLRQPPAPSHFPSKPQVATGIVMQVVESRGVSPAVRLTQVPGELGAAHVLQPAVHASAQQTPSAQKPLAHSALQLHAIPTAFAAGTQGGRVDPAVTRIDRHVGADFADGRVAAIGPGRALAATAGARADDERKKRPHHDPPRHPRQRHFLLGQNAIPQRKFHVIMRVGTRATASCARHANDTCHRGSLGNLSGQERNMSLFAYRVTAHTKSILAPALLTAVGLVISGCAAGVKPTPTGTAGTGGGFGPGIGGTQGSAGSFGGGPPIGGFSGSATAPAAAASTPNTISSRRSPTVYLVVDRSGSMFDCLSTTTNVEPMCAPTAGSAMDTSWYKLKRRRARSSPAWRRTFIRVRDHLGQNETGAGCARPSTT